MVQNGEKFTLQTATSCDQQAFHWVSHQRQWCGSSCMRRADRHFETHCVVCYIFLIQASSAVRGHAVYGLRELALYSPRLSTIIEDCSVAAKSSDARDKYFETFVGESESSSSDALRSELPSLQVRVLCRLGLLLMGASCLFTRVVGRASIRSISRG